MSPILPDDGGINNFLTRFFFSSVILY